MTLAKSNHGPDGLHARANRLSRAAKLSLAASAFAFAAHTLPAANAAGCPPAESSLAALYVLRGIVEVGSEIRLKSDGRFDYMLAYGALDELASGCWSRKGDTVTLAASRFETNRNDPGKFRRLDLRLKRSGALERRFDGDHIGSYERQ